jgi:hypothetical protein
MKQSASEAADNQHTAGKPHDETDLLHALASGLAGDGDDPE